VTALSPHIGYEAASELAREAAETGRTIRQVALERSLFSAEQLDVILSAIETTKASVAGMEPLKKKDR
jgi:aspartate ammonia-lyase